MKRVILLLLPIALSACTPDSPQTTDATSLAPDTIAKLNSELPQMVDEGLRLDSYEAEGDVLIMNITTVGMLVDEIDVDSWMSESKSQVEYAACADPNYRQILDSGVSYEYRYRDENGIPVVTVQLSRSDCR